MPYQAAANLGQAAELAGANCSFAFTDNLQSVSADAEQFRDQFFSLLNNQNPAQLKILRWSTILQYQISLAGVERVTDAWRLASAVAAACQEAFAAEIAGTITPVLAANLLAAYNNAFS